MKKLLLSLVLAVAAFAQTGNITIQKIPANPVTANSNKLTDPSKVIVVGDGGSITATGTGVIVSTGGVASSLPWSGLLAIPNPTLTHTGDVTGTITLLAGGGATGALTLATVNSNVGTFAGITVNGKGLVTAAANRTITTTAPLTGGGVLGNLTLAIPAATGSVNGYLTSADWTTFNAKQTAGNYITALTGDVTAAGPGSAAATLATVASAGTTGSSTAIPVITINAKGLTTSISTAAVVAPAGTLTGTTLASNVLTSSLTTVGGPLTIGSNLFTLGGAHTLSGAFASTFTFTGTTSVTFPTSGTLATVAGTVSSITGTAGQITASASTGAVTLSIPSAMTGINSITSATSTDLALVPSSGKLKINGGAINRDARIPSNTALELRGNSGGDVLQLFSSAGGGFQPFLRIPDGSGSLYMGTNIVITGNTLTTGEGGFAIPYTGNVPSMMSLQSDLGNTAGTSTVVIQSGGPLSKMIDGYGNDTSANNFYVMDSGLIQTRGGIIGGPTGLTITSSATAAQNLLLVPSTTGQVVASIPALGASFQIKGHAATRPIFKIAADDTANVDLTIQNVADGSPAYVAINAGAVNAAKLYHATGQLELLAAIASSSVSTGTLILTGSNAGLGVAGAGYFGGLVSTTGITSPASTNLTIATASFGTSISFASSTGIPTFLTAVAVTGNLTSAGTSSHLFGATAQASIGVSADTTAGILQLITPTSGTFTLTTANALSLTVSGGAAATITGGAGNMAIVAGTGNSRTMVLKTTTSGGTATTFLTGNADQSATFAGALAITGALSGVTTLGASGVVTLSSATASSSTSTGALVLSGAAGGLGVAGRAFFGDYINVRTSSPQAGVDIGATTSNQASLWLRSTNTGSVDWRIYHNSSDGLGFEFNGTPSLTFAATSLNASFGSTTEASNSTTAAMTVAGGLGVAKKIITASSITTGAPSGGTADAWKFGTVVTGVTSTMVTTNYIQLDVAGTLYKIATVTSVP